VSRLPRRLRLVFGLDDPSADTDAPDTTGEVHDFVAYAADCRVFGQLPLHPGRFSDLLNAHEEFELVNVQLESLADGHVVTEPSVVLARDDLIAVHASGVAGQSSVRTQTRAHRIVVRSDPYTIWGEIHALPGSDPIASFQHRPPMVPLTNSRIAYELGGVLGQFELGTLIVNRELAESVRVVAREPATPPEPSA
jgi:hypothetical protein